jgi:hypothetical protein
VTGIRPPVLPWLMQPVMLLGPGRTSLVEHARRIVAACRNVRVGPGEARRQLVAQFERERLVSSEAVKGRGRAGDRLRTPGQTMTDGAVETLRILGEALEASGTPYVVVPPREHDPCRVALPRRHRGRTLRTLRVLADDEQITFEREDARTPHRPVTSWLEPQVSSSPTWRVDRRSGSDQQTPSPGCRLEFWPLDRTLRDRLWRWRWDAYEPPPVRAPARVEQVRIGDRQYPGVGSVAPMPRVDEVTFPIDIVYTWVDGTDPVWMARKDRALRQLDPGFVADADDPSRYHEHDELRYSLRSVAMFADFVRHIYIVTDGQVPPWLDTDHERISIVDHREVFDDTGNLPTFNSHAIESRLHHIEGLAEHYLYLNDDFFFGRRVPADRFFHANGTSKFFVSHARIPAGARSSEGRSVDAAAVNTRELVEQRFGRRVHHKLKHTPYPQRRSVLYEMEAALREEFARTAASRVRSPADVPIPSSLFHYYAYLTGRAVPGRISSQYVSLGEENLAKRLRGLRMRRDFDVLCINDSVDVHTDNLDRRSRTLARFMASYWPAMSPFER